MFKLVAFWSAPKPDEVAAFEEYYAATHVPVAQKAPGLRKLELIRTPKGMEGHAPGFYRVAVLHFDDEQALNRAAETPEWRAMREDAGKMIERFGVSLTTAMGEDTPA
ncbi:MAG: EthD family reductase [Pseudomonadota bacterium]|nr:EthD family reductase [Pseudomonadota bacterium]